MGGYDFFVTRYENGEWTEPVNMGYPINTPADDIFMFISPDGRRMYVSSSRLGGHGGQDIFVYHLPFKKEIAPEILYIYHTYVRDAEATDKLIMDASVKVYVGDSLTGLYRPDPDDGYVLMVLRAGDTVRLEVTAGEDYLPVDTQFYVSPDLVSPVKLDILMHRKIEKPAEPWWVSIERAMPVIYFDFDKADIRKDQVPKLDSIASVLKAHPELKVWIVGNCDAKGSLRYNVNLGKRRAQAVFKELVKRGIDRSRMKIVSLGEVYPARINFTPDGKDNPHARALNRRAEVKVFLSDTQFAHVNPLKYTPVMPYSKLVEEARQTGKVIYTVFIGSSLVRLPADYFHRMKQVYYERHGNEYRYYSGKFYDEKQASEHAKLLKQMGAPAYEIRKIGGSPDKKHQQPSTAGKSVI